MNVTPRPTMEDMYERAEFRQGDRQAWKFIQNDGPERSATRADAVDVLGGAAQRA